MGWVWRGWPQRRSTCSSSNSCTLRLHFIDFSSVFVFCHFPKFLEFIIACLVNLVFYATLGAIFAVLISLCSARHLLLKGAHYGLGVWFFAYTVVALYKIPQLENVSLESAVTNFIAALCYGLATAALLRWLIQKEARQN